MDGMGLEIPEGIDSKSTALLCFALLCGDNKPHTLFHFTMLPEVYLTIPQLVIGQVELLGASQWLRSAENC